MILPIVAYGAPVLRKVARDIDKDYPKLKQLIADMWETMEASNGVGLAAPQINKDIRLFVVDSEVIFENMDEADRLQHPGDNGIRRVFINAHTVNLDGEPWLYNEGCLSIPKIREDVARPDKITLKYFDEDFNERVETFSGISGRVIQHEYDHIEGKLFIDYMKPLRKKMLQGKLNDISKGKIRVDYKMQFVK